MEESSTKSGSSQNAVNDTFPQFAELPLSVIPHIVDQMDKDSQDMFKQCSFICKGIVQKTRKHCPDEVHAFEINGELCIGLEYSFLENGIRTNQFVRAYFRDVDNVEPGRKSLCSVGIQNSIGKLHRQITEGSKEENALRLLRNCLENVPIDNNKMVRVDVNRDDIFARRIVELNFFVRPVRFNLYQYPAQRQRSQFMRVCGLLEKSSTLILRGITNKFEHMKQLPNEFYKSAEFQTMKSVVIRNYLCRNLDDDDFLAKNGSLLDINEPLIDCDVMNEKLKQWIRKENGKYLDNFILRSNRVRTCLGLLFDGIQVYGKDGEPIASPAWTNDIARFATEDAWMKCYVKCKNGVLKHFAITTELDYVFGAPIPRRQ